MKPTPPSTPSIHPARQPTSLAPSALRGPFSSLAHDNYARALDWITRYAPRSIQGRNGSAACFLVAVRLIHRFGLDEHQALAALHFYNDSGKCEPPWSTRELEHKLDDVLRTQPRRSFVAFRSVASTTEPRACPRPPHRPTNRVQPAPAETQDRLFRQWQAEAPRIFDTFRFSPADWLRISPAPIPADPHLHGLLFLRALPPEECVWIAQSVKFSGHPRPACPILCGQCRAKG